MVAVREKKIKIEEEKQNRSVLNISSASYGVILFFLSSRRMRFFFPFSLFDRARNGRKKPHGRVTVYADPLAIYLPMGYAHFSSKVIKKSLRGKEKLCVESP